MQWRFRPEMQAGQRRRALIRFGENATDFPIDPERVAPLLRRLISPTRTRARRSTIRRGDDPRFPRSLRCAASSRPSICRRSARKKGMVERRMGWVKLWYRPAGELPAMRRSGPANGRE